MASTIPTPPEGAIVSGRAMQLHALAVIATHDAAVPGCISDALVGRLLVETLCDITPAAEVVAPLLAARRWERAPDGTGYRIVELTGEPLRA